MPDGLTRDQAHGQHVAASHADRLRQYDDGIATWREQHDTEQDTSHLDPAAIAACPRCNDEGYRGQRICDHLDHYESTASGRAAVRAELDRIAARRRGGAA